MDSVELQNLSRLTQTMDGTKIAMMMGVIGPDMGSRIMLRILRRIHSLYKLITDEREIRTLIQTHPKSSYAGFFELFERLDNSMRRASDVYDLQGVFVDPIVDRVRNNHKQMDVFLNTTIQSIDETSADIVLSDFQQHFVSNVVSQAAADADNDITSYMEALENDFASPLSTEFVLTETGGDVEISDEDGVQIIGDIGTGEDMEIIDVDILQAAYDDVVGVPAATSFNGTEEPPSEVPILSPSKSVAIADAVTKRPPSITLRIDGVPDRGVTRAITNLRDTTPNGLFTDEDFVRVSINKKLQDPDAADVPIRELIQRGKVSLSVQPHVHLIVPMNNGVPGPNEVFADVVALTWHVIGASSKHVDPLQTIFVDRSFDYAGVNNRLITKEEAINRVRFLLNTGRYSFYIEPHSRFVIADAVEQSGMPRRAPGDERIFLMVGAKRVQGEDVAPPLATPRKWSEVMLALKSGGGVLDVTLDSMSPTVRRVWLLPQNDGAVPYRFFPAPTPNALPNEIFSQGGAENDSFINDEPESVVEDSDPDEDLDERIMTNRNRFEALSIWTCYIDIWGDEVHRLEDDELSSVIEESDDGLEEDLVVGEGGGPPMRQKEICDARRGIMDALFIGMDIVDLDMAEVSRLDISDRQWINVFNRRSVKKVIEDAFEDQTNFLGVETKAPLNAHHKIASLEDVDALVDHIRTIRTERREREEETVDEVAEDNVIWLPMPPRMET